MRVRGHEVVFSDEWETPPARLKGIFAGARGDRGDGEEGGVRTPNQICWEEIAIRSISEQVL